VRLARLLLEAGEPMAALKALKATWQAVPEARPRLTGLILAACERSRQRQVAAEWIAAVPNDHLDLRTLERMADWYRRGDELGGTVRMLERALELQPKLADWSRIKLRVAALQVRREKKAAAIRHAQAVYTRPGVSEAQKQMAKRLMDKALAIPDPPVTRP